MIGLVHGKDARASDPDIVRIDHLPAGVEAHDHATFTVGDKDIAERVHGTPFRLDEGRRLPGLWRAPREELDAAIGQPVEDADAAIAIERGDEDLPTATAAAHLRVNEGRAVEIPGLGGRSETGAPDGDAVHGGEVVVLAAAVASARTREEERALGIHEHGGGRRNAAARRAAGRLEALARHIDAHRETGREQDFRESGRGKKAGQPEGQTRGEARRSITHPAAILPERAREVKPPAPSGRRCYTPARESSETPPWIQIRLVPAP